MAMEKALEKYASQVALVTGASSGIGAAIAKELTRIGMTVIAVARRRDRLQAVRDEVKEASGTFVVYQADCTVHAEIYELFRYIKEHYIGVNVLVNNAGSILQSALLDGNPEEWQYLMNLHLISRCLTAQLTIKSLRERKLNEGHIFNISSIAGRQVIPVGFTHFYSSTKFALHAATEGFRIELKLLKSKIKITEIAPGFTDTELLKNIPKEKLPEEYEEIEPLLPEDIALVVLQVLMLPLRAEFKQAVIGPTVDVPLLKSLLPDVIAQRELDKKLKEEAERKLKEEAERKLKEEAERKLKEEAEKNGKEEAGKNDEEKKGKKDEAKNVEEKKGKKEEEKKEKEQETVKTRKQTKSVERVRKR